MEMLEEQGYQIIPNVIDSRTISSLTQIIDGSSLQRSRAGIRNPSYSNSDRSKS
jgi:hypothetical protein